jgi:hypothetical protein
MRLHSIYRSSVRQRFGDRCKSGDGRFQKASRKSSMQPFTRSRLHDGIFKSQLDPENASLWLSKVDIVSRGRNLLHMLLEPQAAALGIYCAYANEHISFWIRVPCWLVIDRPLR